MHLLARRACRRIGRAQRLHLVARRACRRIRRAQRLHLLARRACMRIRWAHRLRLLARLVGELRRRDPDLAGVHAAAAHAKLPEAERKEWQAIWEQVDALIRRGSETKLR
jgi:hypothetical protein